MFKNQLELAKTLRSQQSNMYATHDNMESLQEYIHQMSGQERALAFMIMGITINTVLEVLAVNAEEGEL